VRDVRLARFRRPLLAAFLSLLVVGLGHLYLRRLKRAAAWVVLTVGTGVVWVPTDALDGVWSGTQVDPIVLAPVIAIAAMAAIDAFSVARESQRQMAITAEGDLLTCPVCGNDVDPDLDFCHWCTTDLDQFTVVEADEVPSNHDHDGQ
jgi:uncharacterized paraquat-inducible protein A